MRNIKNLLVLLLSFSLLSSISIAEEDKNQPTTIIINSRVSGSQEQPKVLYIMPWQGIKNPIVIKGSKRTIVMPKFQPINPKVFKQQVSDFHKKLN